MLSAGQLRSLTNVWITLREASGPAHLPLKLIYYYQKLDICNGSNDVTSYQIHVLSYKLTYCHTNSRTVIQTYVLSYQTHVLSYKLTYCHTNSRTVIPNSRTVIPNSRTVIHTHVLSYQTHVLSYQTHVLSYQTHKIILKRTIPYRFGFRFSKNLLQILKDI